MIIDPKILSALAPSAKIVVLTGAGISAESGIPTFRDAHQGLWSKYSPEELALPTAFDRDPNLVIDWYHWRRSMVLQAMPNAGHSALVILEQWFQNFTVITQNVDGLHLKAGSKNVVEIHGSIHKMKCSTHGHSSPWVESGGDLAKCKTCGSYLRPDIVWFGEEIARENLLAIDEAMKGCEVFLAIGTSSLVFPAAGLMPFAKLNGAITLSINTDPDGKGDADLLLLGKATAVLTDLVDAILSRKRLE